MVRAYPRACSETPEVRRTIHVRLDFAAHAPDKFRRKATRRLLGTTAEAGTESGLLRRLGYGEEQHLLRARAAGWAGRPAINSRRAYGIDERAVQACIPRSDSREASSSRRRLNCWQLVRWLRHGSESSFRKQHIGTGLRGAIRILRSNSNFLAAPCLAFIPAGAKSSA